MKNNFEIKNIYNNNRCLCFDKAILRHSNISYIAKVKIYL